MLEEPEGGEVTGPLRRVHSTVGWAVTDIESVESRQ